MSRPRNSQRAAKTRWRKRVAAAFVPGPAPEATRRNNEAPLMVLWFVCRFGLGVALLYVALLIPPVGVVLNERYLDALSLTATAAGSLAGLFADHVVVSGCQIETPGFRAELIPGCGGLQIVAYYVCAALSLPFWSMRLLLSALVSVLCLLVVNTIRVASLVWVGSWDPSCFDFAHSSIWQPVMVFCAIAVWLGTLVYVQRSGGRAKPARTDEALS